MMLNGLAWRALLRNPRKVHICSRYWQRCNHTSAAAPAVEEGSLFLSQYHNPPILKHRSSTQAQDDETLRKVFDHHNFWIEFSSRKRLASNEKPVGLLQNGHLTTAEGFDSFASSTLQKCKRLVEKITSATTQEEYRSTAQDFDQLSDYLCRVIDLSDFVRSTHPDQVFKAAADRAYSMMYEYMNILNTNTGLNNQLRRVLQMSNIVRSWSEEERVVARQLLTDFTKSAIHLSSSERQQFVKLSNDISQSGFNFVNNIEPEKLHLKYSLNRMKGLEPSKIKEMTYWGRVFVPTVGPDATAVLRKVADPDVRREVYIANRSASIASIQRLESMLQTRAKLATLCGYQNFANMALSDKMARSPEAVAGFLSSLVKDNNKNVLVEVSELLELKQAYGFDHNYPTQINAWDRDYYTSQILANLATPNVQAHDPLSMFFPLGRVMQGLSRLFNRLYGVRLVPIPTGPGEVWHEKVRRLDVVDERHGRIAVVYCDLFEREEKNPNPAHFTLRCSRRIREGEIAQVAETGLGPFDSPVDVVTDGMVSGRNIDDGQLYQLPTIALICDFCPTKSRFLSASAEEVTLLSFREVQTLFHEMGHAIHSILGRTALHNVAGTRCATDFAELPSVLMEHFASAPDVLALFARHYKTGEPVPLERVAARVTADRRLQASETESQILLAALDQQLHSLSERDAAALKSTDVYQRVFAQYSSIPEPAGTSYQGLFGHLFGYGATYYSYLFDRAIASKIWTDVFKQGNGGGAVDREAGEKFKDEVLKWGGSRDGWKCIAGVLNDHSLSEGGRDAMAKVGKWGIVS